MNSKIVSCILFCGLAWTAAAQPIEIKMATLAPKDSPWCDVLTRMGEKWKVISKGNVKLTIFAGGVMGDSRSQLIVVDASGKGERIITTDFSIYSPALSP